MNFKKGMFIDEKSLNKEEAEEFKSFLLSELQRHKEHMIQYQSIARDDEASTFMRVVALTVIQRNLEDIQHTNRTLTIVNKILEEL